MTERQLDIAGLTHQPGEHLWVTTRDGSQIDVLDSQAMEGLAKLREVYAPAPTALEVAEAQEERRQAKTAEAAPTFAPVPLSSLDTSPPLPMLLNRLDPIEHTILYGPGAVGKGALASAWITQLVKLGRRVLILDYENHGSEWARRITGLGGAEATENVKWIAPLALGLGPIWKIASQVREHVASDGFDYVVIDSAVMACAGHDPMDPKTPQEFYRALQEIGVPTLTLAHVNRLHDVRYPFGSVFWHNLARVTWSLMPKGEEILLTCQKASNYAKPPAAAVSMTWLNGMLREVWEKPAVVVLMDRIIEVLADGPMTAPEIAAALNDGLPSEEHTTSGTVRAALSRELKHGPSSRVTVNDGRWRLISDDNQ